MMWSKIIEAKWDAINDAMQKAAHDAGEGDGDSDLRVELNADGTIHTYWTQMRSTSADVYNGNAIRVADYFGGEFWDEEWADNYDAAYDLDALLNDVRFQEKNKEKAERWAKKNA